MLLSVSFHPSYNVEVRDGIIVIYTDQVGDGYGEVEYIIASLSSSDTNPFCKDVITTSWTQASIPFPARKDMIPANRQETTVLSFS